MAHTALWENRLWCRAFAAQITSLFGTGITSIALALLVQHISGADASFVLGMILTLKMVCYVGIAPFSHLIIDRVPAKTLLVVLDLVRALCLLVVAGFPTLPVIVAAMAVVYGCAALFTPVFQALIPDLFKDEQSYTKAMAYSRMAYDVENILSPILAGVFLLMLPAAGLFAVDALTFCISAALIAGASFQAKRQDNGGLPFYQRAAFGLKVYMRTPRLVAGLLLLQAGSFMGAVVIVMSVVLVQTVWGLPETRVPVLMGCAGLGAIVASVCSPWALRFVSTRAWMLSGAVLLVLAAAIGSQMVHQVWGMHAIWVLLGCGSGMVALPMAILLRRSSSETGRTRLFAAQFAVSHAGWLVAYLAVGWVGTAFGFQILLLAVACVSALCAFAGGLLWPRQDSDVQEHIHTACDHLHEHTHDDPHHQHIHEGWEGPAPHAHPHRHVAVRHTHAFVIDEHHPIWPK